MTRPAPLPSKWRGALILLWFFLGTAFTHAELHVTKTLWGFNGDALPGRQALLTIEIENRGSREFSGEIFLKAGDNDLTQTGISHSNEVYLTPGQRRWIQFHPYVKNKYTKFRLTWGMDGIFDVGLPGFGPPATVMLADVDGLGTAGARMRVFPENAFPTSLAALDQLHAVVMDHVPRWDSIRRTVFLDWIKSGGIVHLVLGADGKRPEFTEELVLLNKNEKAYRVGLGQVVFHELPRQEITEQTLAAAGYPGRTLKPRDDNYYYYQDINQVLLEHIGLRTKAEIAWHIIFVLTLFYIALIGPVYFMLRKKDYRFLLALFLGSVAGFSVLFMMIGRRGYGESQVTHTLTVAKVITPGRCSIKQWVNAFATEGGVYAFQHPTESRFYSAVSMQSVPGKAREGKDGALLADIPLFTPQPFIFQGVMKCSTPDVRIKKTHNDDGGTQEFDLEIPSIQSSAPPLMVMVRHRDQFCEMKLDADGTWKKSGVYQEAEKLMSYDKWQRLDRYNFRRRNKQQAETAMNELWPALMAISENRDLYFDKNETLNHLPLPEDVLRVYIYTKAPTDLNPTATGFANGGGYVLYISDLALPDVSKSNLEEI